jgi:hypothetical protein
MRSASVIANIILDTRNPSVTRIEARDLTTDDPTWSNERRVKVIITGATDPLPGRVGALELAEDPDFTQNVQVLTFNPETPEVIYEVAETPFHVTGYTMPGREDGRVIFARVLDRAENRSQRFIHPFSLISGKIL